jgi:uncharacterized protein (TIGR03083 family)
VQKTLEFPDLLRLIDERSAAFIAAVASAPSLEAQVPTCPEWTLFDLARHLGEGRRSWAATVAAGPGAAAKSEVPAEPAAPREREALLAWFAASTRELLDALREAGPDRGCWTWWGDSQSPQNCGAVARHQLHEGAVHTYDAQVTAGAPEPLPEDVALDGIGDFLFTCCASASPWPHKPATFDYHAAEGPSWRETLDADGERAALLPAGTGEGRDAADVSIRGTASELVLFFYDRIPMDSMRIDGDTGLIDLLRTWDPDA